MLLTLIKAIGSPAAFLYALIYAYSKTPVVLFVIASVVIIAAFANSISIKRI